MADEIKVEVTAPAEPVSEVVAPVTPSPAAQMHEMGEVMRVAREVLQVDALLSALAESRGALESVREELRGMREEFQRLISRVEETGAAAIVAAQVVAESAVEEVQQADEIQDAENVREAVGTALVETGAAAEEVGQTPLAEATKKRGREWL